MGEFSDAGRSNIRDARPPDERVHDVLKIRQLTAGYNDAMAAQRSPEERNLRDSLNMRELMSGYNDVLAARSGAHARHNAAVDALPPIILFEGNSNGHSKR